MKKENQGYSRFTWKMTNRTSLCVTISKDWPSRSSLAAVDVCIPTASAGAVHKREDWRRWADHPRRRHRWRWMPMSMTWVTGWSRRSLEPRAHRTRASRCTAHCKDRCSCLDLRTPMFNDRTSSCKAWVFISFITSGNEEYKVSLLVYKCLHQAAPSSGWDVRSRFSNRQPMSPPLCNTRRPGSSTHQTGKIRKKKFLCVWSAAVELTTTDCPWCIIDTDSVLRTIEDFSVFHSLRDIIIAPMWQFLL